MRQCNDRLPYMARNHALRFHTSCHGAGMITSEQLAIACVAFSFFGACVGYWMCWERHKPRNHPVIEAQRNEYASRLLHAEIERTRKEVAEAKRRKRAYAAKERRLKILTAWSL